MATEAKQAYKAYMQAKADRTKYQELHSKATMKTMTTQAEQASYISKAFGDQQNSLRGLYKALEYLSHSNDISTDHTLKILGHTYEAMGH